MAAATNKGTGRIGSLRLIPKVGKSGNRTGAKLEETDTGEVPHLGLEPRSEE